MLLEHDVQDVWKKTKLPQHLQLPAKEIKVCCYTTQTGSDVRRSAGDGQQTLKRNQFRNPAPLVLHIWGNSAVVFSGLCNQLEMSWERHFVCSGKHGPESINLGWKLIVTLQRNLIFAICSPDKKPFRGAAGILRDVRLDLTTASDLFDWWKRRGKCSGGSWGPEAPAW